MQRLRRSSCQAAQILMTLLARVKGNHQRHERPRKEQAQLRGACSMGVVHWRRIAPARHLWLSLAAKRAVFMAMRHDASRNSVLSSTSGRGSDARSRTLDSIQPCTPPANI